MVAEVSFIPSGTFRGNPVCRVRSGRLQRHREADQRETMRRLAGWYASERGARVLASLDVLLQQWLSQADGLLAVEVSGFPGHTAWVRGADFGAYFRIAPEGADVSARFDSLPIGNESSDVVIVFHALALVDDPRHFLSEVERILVSRGHCVIVTFNTFGLMGLVQPFGSPADAPRCGRFYPLWRLRRRLVQLGFSLEKHVWLPLPFSDCGRSWYRGIHSALARSLSWLGGVYVLHARKQVAGAVLSGEATGYQGFIRNRFVQPTVFGQHQWPGK